MSELLADFRTDYDRVSIPTIWVAVFLSVLLHALLIWQWLPDLHLLSLDNPKDQVASGRMQVQLVPRAAPKPIAPPSPPAAPAVRAQPPAPQAAPAPKAAPRPPPKPPVLAMNRPGPDKAPQPKAPEPAKAAPPGDLSSYVAAQRRARGEATPAPPSAPAPAAESATDRFDQVVASNLGLDRTPEFGYNKDRVGGVFQIKRLGYEDAEFLFFGWNKDIQRKTDQLIEVRRGNNSSIEIAVVRKMIEIIRQNAPDDFVWISRRLGKNVTLSSRLRDNAGLEDFMMQEFFSDQRER
jgi:hypothetical protein